MKKFGLLLALILAFSFVMAGCSGDTGTSQPTDNSVDAPSDNNDSGAQTPTQDNASSGKPYKVVVCLSNQLGDKAQSDQLWEGAQKIMAEDPDVDVKFLEGKGAADWEPNILAALEDDYDLIFITAASQKDIIMNHAPNYPDKKIIAVDGIVKDHDNVMSAFCEQNVGSFVMGALAAYWTVDTSIPGVNEDKIVGWIAGMENPIANDFWVGYEQGVHYVDPDIQILKAFAGSFTDPLKVKELALTQYDQGADIIMAVASSAGMGLFDAAQEKNLYAIGLDFNQDDQAPGLVVTSMVKNASMATYDLIKRFKADPDSFQGGEIYTMDFKSGGIEMTDFSAIKEGLGDNFPEDLIPKLEAIIEDINNGNIIVNEQEGVR